MNPALVDHCLELLAPLGVVRSRRMFGGHGLYIDDLFVAIVAFDRLYLKTDEATRATFDDAGATAFAFDKEGETVTTSYRTVPAEPWRRRP
jgi:DNA transformation protein and related proteins